MNLNLMSFPSVCIFQNPNFYPKIEVGDCSLIIFKEKNIPIQIKHPEIVAEIGSHFSIFELQFFKKIIYDSDNLQ